MKNEKISKLTEEKIAELSDLFMVSEMYSDTTYISKNISCNFFVNDFIKTIEHIPYFNPTGKWNFINGFTIPTKTVLSAYKNGLSTCVVNYDYLSSTFLKEFNKLSSDCSKYIPSHVGEVIYSTKLGSEKKMSECYGPHTKWKKVEGRFILATNSKNKETALPDKTGGTELVTLGISDIPAHSHIFKSDTTKKNFSASFTLSPETNPSNVAVISTKDKPGLIESDKPRPDYSEGSGGISLPATTLSANPGAKMVSAGVLYGNEGEEITIYPFSSNETTKHNNLPPFFTVYMWERIS